ncbi:MAG: FecR domain-containing protein [Prevotella sp.]|nr:FecR domain-containing protein [Prevotella sp.]
MQIQYLIIKSLFATLDERERRLLDEWLKEPGHAMMYQRISHDIEDKDDAVRFLADIDTEDGLKQVYERRRSKRLKIFRYAAIFLGVVALGAFFYYSQYTKVTPPAISDAVQLAMQVSRESGRQVAEVDVLSEELRVKSEESLATVSGSQSDVDHSSLFTLHSSLTKEQLLTARRMTTRHDKEFWVTLDDGSLVHLNYNTRLIYPEKFGRGDRNVILEGEAYFMVAKDKSRPFVVHTPDGAIRVHGTEFNVNTRINDNGNDNVNDNVNGGRYRTEVVLVKGSISVTPAKGKEQMMKPGEQCKITNTQCVIENVDVAPYVAWNTGTFVFDNCPLETAMKVLSHWYGFEVVYLNEAIKKERITGDFDRYVKPDQLLDAISKSSGLTMRKENKTIFIK